MRKIKNHVEELFKDFPVNKEVIVMKEEITQNLEEKVQYLMDQGKSEEDAINKAIVDFGDVEELKESVGVVKPEIAKRKKKLAILNLQFALIGSALIIALFLFINFYYTPDIIWFIYPTFAISWWPLAMYYVYRRKN